GTRLHVAAHSGNVLIYRESFSDASLKPQAIVATTPQYEHIPSKIAHAMLRRQYFCATVFSAACRVAFLRRRSHWGSVLASTTPAAWRLIPPPTFFRCSDVPKIPQSAFWYFPLTDGVRDGAETATACRCRRGTSSYHREAGPSEGCCHREAGRR